jgi:hypothetical protein
MCSSKVQHLGVEAGQEVLHLRYRTAVHGSAWHSTAQQHTAQLGLSLTERHSSTPLLLPRCVASSHLLALMGLNLFQIGQQPPAGSIAAAAPPPGRGPWLQGRSVSCSPLNKVECSMRGSCVSETFLTATDHAPVLPRPTGTARPLPCHTPTPYTLCNTAALRRVNAPVRLRPTGTARATPWTQSSGRS